MSTVSYTKVYSVELKRVFWGVKVYFLYGESVLKSVLKLSPVQSLHKWGNNNWWCGCLNFLPNASQWTPTVCALTICMCAKYLHLEKMADEGINFQQDETVSDFS